jgi:hypothetical protein
LGLQNVGGGENRSSPVSGDYSGELTSPQTRAPMPYREAEKSAIADFKASLCRAKLKYVNTLRWHNYCSEWAYAYWINFH